MDYLYQNEDKRWVIKENEHELHSGDPIRVVIKGQLFPARIQKNDETGDYVIIINAGETIIPITPDIDIQPIFDGIL